MLRRLRDTGHPVRNRGTVHPNNVAAVGSSAFCLCTSASGPVLQVLVFLLQIPLLRHIGGRLLGSDGSLAALFLELFRFIGAGLCLECLVLMRVLTALLAACRSFD